MMNDLSILAVICLALAGYLGYSLLRPEKF
jgi:K+-transporting ATPase KdpF subunit